MAVVVSFVGKWDGKDIERARRELGEVGNTATNSGGKLSTLGKVAGAAALGGLALATAGAVKFGKASIDAAQESVVSDARLKAVAKSMGFMSGAYKGGYDRLNEYANKLQTSIGIEDESIKAVQAKLLTFRQLGQTMNQTGGMMDRATAAAYDLAAAGFGSAESNATQLGKALQDPVKGLASLGRAGVTFSEHQKKVIESLVKSGEVGKAQEIVMKAIESQVGGTAKATATASDKMKVSFGELQEKVGMALLPAVNKLADTLGPIFTQLQGPLGAVAESLGGALSQAIGALAPLLPPLATAFGQIAGVLGSTLTTVIQALIPVLTPVMQLMGDLASRIGPILAPILQKLGSLLGALLAAVMPLIEPLMTVVMDILDAAAPIIGVVVDALIMIVNALAPVLGAVGQLIQPLGQLINVLLKAIMPVLQPLLPVIDFLAKLLGDVLTRAVGVLMTAIGFLVQSFATAAPAVLNNFVRPVTGFLLTFAENALDAMSSAFGWIPGLGDKLTEAKDMLHTFKGNADKALGEAADSIGKEGMKIGKNLVDNGIKMMTDPAAAQATANAGFQVGKNLTDGVATGLASPGAVNGVEQASMSVIRAAEAAARRQAQSKSPSKVFSKLGTDLTDGLAVGVKGGEKKIRKAMQEAMVGWYSKIKDQLKSKLDDAKELLRGWQDTVSSAISGGVDFGSAIEFTTTDAKDVSKTFGDGILAALSFSDAKPWVEEIAAKMGEDADGNQVVLEAAKTVSHTFMEGLTLQRDQAVKFSDQIQKLMSMGLSETAIGQVLSAGADAGSAIAQELIDGGASAITNANDLVSATQAAADTLASVAGARYNTAGSTIASDFMTGLQGQVSGATTFADKVKTLIDMGLSQPAIDNILAAGATTGGAIADQLIAGGTTAIGNLNAMMTQLQAAAGPGSPLATTGQAAFYQQGIDNAQKLFDGFKEKLGKGGPVRKQLENLMDRIAKDGDRHIQLNVKVEGILKKMAKSLGVDLSDLDGKAAGGSVYRSTPYMVGERGPELFVPDVSGSIVPNGAFGAASTTSGGNTYNVTVQAGVGDPRQIGQTIVEYIRRYERANGKEFVSAR